jgi:hypothetical protein
MREALRQRWWGERTHRPREMSTDVLPFDVEGFEERLVATERRMQAEERRLRILALEGEIPRGHVHDRT